MTNIETKIEESFFKFAKRNSLDVATCEVLRNHSLNAVSDRFVGAEGFDGITVLYNAIPKGRGFVFTEMV